MTTDTGTIAVVTDIAPTAGEAGVHPGRGHGRR
jgi:hypothetical protein